MQCAEYLDSNQQWTMNMLLFKLDRSSQRKIRQSMETKLHYYDMDTKLLDAIDQTFPELTDWVKRQTGMTRRPERAASTQEHPQKNVRSIRRRAFAGAPHSPETGRAEKRGSDKRRDATPGGGHEQDNPSIGAAVTSLHLGVPEPPKINTK
jgi:hypothetical protein